MPGFIGKILISLSFFITTLSLMFYFVAAQKDSERHLKVGNWLFAIKGVLILVASGILLDLLITHQFQYYYVFNYTSLDLDLKYLISAFYGGQEGSFLLWILFSWLAGFSLMKWTRAPYKAPVMFFLALTQFFLLTMVLGWKLDGISIGASPFRTIAEEMPNAPFIQANPDFVPADGSGLNDLLKSPWMMIHPPILFLGFASMTIPYAFAMAALWKQKYNEWVAPALPWTLAANLALLIAIFLGAYWEGIGVRRLKGRAREGQKRAPGDLGFDPLGLLPDKDAPERRKRMLEQELTHGRTAMLAIVGFAIQEFLTKVPVVEETPQFFVPPEGVEQAFFPHVGENFFLRKDVEAEFYLFELVGEILKGFLPTVPH